MAARVAAASVFPFAAWVCAGPCGGGAAPRAYGWVWRAPRPRWSKCSPAPRVNGSRARFAEARVALLARAKLECSAHLRASVQNLWKCTLLPSPTLIHNRWLSCCPACSSFRHFCEGWASQHQPVATCLFTSVCANRTTRLHSARN